MEAVEKQVNFSIDGEYICNLARSWFWDEDRPFETCERLLLSCLSNEQIPIKWKKEIVVDILEGKKKLVGINVLTLVNDGENVRPLSQKIEQYRKKEKIRQIREDIECRPAAYIDRYSCPKDPDEYSPVDDLNYSDRKEIEDAFGNRLTPCEEVRIWAYSYDNPLSRISRIEAGFWDEMQRPFLDNGLYLLERPELVYDLIGEPASRTNEDRLFDGLFEHFQKLAVSETVSEKARKEIRLRNKKYTASIRNQAKATEPTQAAGKEEYRDHFEAEHGFNAAPEPDDLLSEYGLIDRQGNYYSCAFAGHQEKAFSIICEDYDKYIHDDKFCLSYDNALDILYNAGWAIIRNPDPAGSVFFDYRYNLRPTKRQIDRAFDHMIRFNEHTLHGIEKYLED